MLWDDELETLTKRVREAYGDLAVSEAYVRALSAAPALPEEVVPEEALTAKGLLPEESRDATKFVDGRVSATYLKAELRRMLMPQ
jgi:hypothetical protein